MLAAFRSSWAATTAPRAAPLLGGAAAARRGPRVVPRSAGLLTAPQEARLRESLLLWHDQARVAGLPAERDRGALHQQRRLGCGR